MPGHNDGRMDGRAEGLTDPILEDPSGYCRGSKNHGSFQNITYTKDEEKESIEH